MAHDKEKKVPAVSLCSLSAAGTDTTRRCRALALRGGESLVAGTAPAHPPPPPRAACHTPSSGSRRCCRRLLLPQPPSSAPGGPSALRSASSAPPPWTGSTRADSLPLSGHLHLGSQSWSLASQILGCLAPLCASMTGSPGQKT